MTRHFLKHMALISYVLMLTINIFADITLLNGVSANDVSSTYMNLYVPSNYTFTIWGVIYIFLGLYVFYSMGNLKEETEEKLVVINKWFIISNVINVCWVIVWHYEMMLLSFLLMILLMTTLVGVSYQIQNIKRYTKDRFFISFPFALYFGWVAVTVLVNFMALLTSFGFKLEPIVTILVIALGMIVGIYMTYKKRIMGFGLMLIWGYVGILYRHLSYGGYDGAYPEIIIATSTGIVMMIVLEVIMMIINRREERKEE